MVIALNWTNKAIKHLEIIYRNLAKHSVQSAIKMHNCLIDATEPLLLFPEMAPLEPLLRDYPKKYRSLVIERNYKLIYYIESETIYIVAVWCCRQHPNRLRSMFFASSL